MLTRPVQREGGSTAEEQAHDTATQGIAGAGTSLPFADEIQASFGDHDVSGIRAHTDTAARTAAADMGAAAYATGNHVAFGEAPDRHTAAHEAAHVVQQRAGIQLKGGIGESGDAYEQEANAVADRVVAGESAAPLLARYPAVGATQVSTGVQHQEAGAKNPSDRKDAPLASGPVAGGICEPGEGVPQATAVPQPSLDEVLGTGRNAAQMTALVRDTFLPAYRSAVDALDALATLELARQVVGAMKVAEKALDDVLIAAPDENPHRWMVSAPGRVELSENEVRARYADLLSMKATLEAEVSALTQELAQQIGPQVFRGTPVLGSMTTPKLGKNATGYLANEAGTVVELLAVIGRIRVVAGVPSGGSCAVLDRSQREEIANLTVPWRSRPVNFAFLVRVLTEEGIWDQVANERSASGKTLAEVDRSVVEQAQRTGALTDVGELDTDSLLGLFSPARTEGADIDDDMDADVDGSATVRPFFGDGHAMAVFEKLRDAAPDARGPILREVQRLGYLGQLCEHLPWKYVEAMHDAVAPTDPQAAAMLRPYFEDKGGGRSMHQIYMDEVNEDLDEGQDVRAFGWFFLDFVHNAFTAGFQHEYSAAYDAHEQGWTTDDQFRSSATKSLGKAALILGVSAVTGGIAGEFAGGVAQGLGAGRSAAQLIGGGVGGFASGVGGHFTGDVYDQLLNDKDGFDSFGSYMQSGAMGGAMGIALAGVSLAGGKYLPAHAQRTADLYVARYPRMTHVLDQIRGAGANAGVGTRAGAVKVRMKVQEYLDVLDDGGFGGGPPAYAIAGVGNLRALPPDLEIDVNVRVPSGLNRPMAMSAGEGSEGSPKGAGATDSGQPDVELPKIEVESVEVSPSVAVSSEESAAGTVSRAFKMTAADIDVVFTAMKATGRLSGDMDVLDGVMRRARSGDPGALGEMEAVQRWLAEGKTVEVNPEHQNAGVTNPDYRVNGKTTEIKSRADAPSKRWLKDRIHEAGEQLEGSITKETGDVELQLRGEDARMPFSDVERQVKGGFNASRGLHVDRVAVYQDGVLVGEWIRTPSGVQRTYPVP
jgi:hypothetical protein